MAASSERQNGSTVQLRPSNHPSDAERSKLAASASMAFLIQLFIYQMTHGCQDANCTRALCLTCRRKIHARSKKPFRQYTSLSAYTIAHALAGAPKAPSKLCSSLSAVFEAENRSIADALSNGPVSKLKELTYEYLGETDGPQLTPGGVRSRLLHTQHGNLEISQNNVDNDAHPERDMEANQDIHIAARPPGIDASSLTQRLFRTNVIQKSIADPINMLLDRQLQLSVSRSAASRQTPVKFSGVSKHGATIEIKPGSVSTAECHTKLARSHQTITDLLDKDRSHGILDDFGEIDHQDVTAMDVLLMCEKLRTSTKKLQKLTREMTSNPEAPAISSELRIERIPAVLNSFVLDLFKTACFLRATMADEIGGISLKSYYENIRQGNGRVTDNLTLAESDAIRKFERLASRKRIDQLLQRFLELDAELREFEFARIAIREHYTTQTEDAEKHDSFLNLMDLIASLDEHQHACIKRPLAATEPTYHSPIARILLTFLVRKFIQDWNGDYNLQRQQPCESILLLLRDMYRAKDKFSMSDEDFRIPYIGKQLLWKKALHEWAHPPNLIKHPYFPFLEMFKDRHIFGLPFVFQTTELNTCVRELLTYNLMAVAGAARYYRRAAADRGTSPRSSMPRLGSFRYLALTIRRGHELEDAFDQLWRHNVPEIWAPLKVNLGRELGEAGQDLGGISQEFFNQIFAQAKDPRYRLFDILDESGKQWFHPQPLEPLYKYTLLGRLAGLAMHNGLMLPLQLPLAFYRYLLGLDTFEPDDIKDAWPTIAKTLQSLLDYEGDDFESVFDLNFDFTISAHGQVYTIDVSKDFPDLNPPNAETLKANPQAYHYAHPLRTLESNTPVTQENKRDYVAHYIKWLFFRSVADHCGCFVGGFLDVIPRRIIRLLPPADLQAFIEGTPTISVETLKAYTRYSGGFARTDSQIEAFWNLMEGFTNDERQDFLEFVTASRNLPALPSSGTSEEGRESDGTDPDDDDDDTSPRKRFTLILERTAANDNRLPSSSTCNRLLWLPEYSSREVLEKNLRKALSERMGFGFA